MDRCHLWCLEAVIMPKRRKQPDFTETTVRPDKEVQPPPMEDGEAVTEKVEQDPGHRQKKNQGGEKDDPLAA
jgi:hypothetical protein